MADSIRAALSHVGSNVLTERGVIPRYLSVSGSLLTVFLVIRCCIKFQLVFVAAFF